jgi:hypothetical protein
MAAAICRSQWQLGLQLLRLRCWDSWPLRLATTWNSPSTEIVLLQSLLPLISSVYATVTLEFFSHTLASTAAAGTANTIIASVAAAHCLLFMLWVQHSLLQIKIKHRWTIQKKPFIGPKVTRPSGSAGEGLLGHSKNELNSLVIQLGGGVACKIIIVFAPNQRNTSNSTNHRPFFAPITSFLLSHGMNRVLLAWTRITAEWTRSHWVHKIWLKVRFPKAGTGYLDQSWLKQGLSGAGVMGSVVPTAAGIFSEWW